MTMGDVAGVVEAVGDKPPLVSVVASSVEVAELSVEACSLVDGPSI